MFRWKLLSLSIIALILATSAMAVENDRLERKRDEFIDIVMNGNGPRFWSERVWVWLEKMKTGEIDPETYYVEDVDDVHKPVGEVVSNIVRAWGTTWMGEDRYPPYGAWRWAESTPATALIWMLYRYKDTIRPEDLAFLENLYYRWIRDYFFGSGSENSQLHEMVGRYLYSQNYQGAQVQYSESPPPNENIYEFTWEGRTYTPGQTYSAYALSRDWLQEHTKDWILYGNGELESPNYTWAFVHAFCTLYEFSQDLLMKRKAKMFLDFLLLESVLDFSGNQWGGAMGRTYEGSYRKGVSRFYWDTFWDAAPPSHEPSYNILFGSYRLPDAIWDIGDLSDEPDNYHHLNMEYNNSIVHSPRTGKWNYVTKFYNLGGRLGSGWQLCIASDDPTSVFSGRTGIPFRVWTNTRDTGEDISNPVDYEDYLVIGEFGYQYNNSIFARGSHLHIARGANSWDVEDEIGYYRFFKEGRTMMGVTINTGDMTSGLEVAIEGVDYGSFEEFKTAFASRAYSGSHNFTNSRGDEIGAGMMASGTDFGPVVKLFGEDEWFEPFDFPFKRIKAVDHLGRVMVDFPDTYTMVVTKNGRRLTYDFTNWTVAEGDAPADITPPSQVSGVAVAPKG